MQVLEDHQYRLTPRQRLELPQQRRQCPLLLALRAEVERREALAAGKRQHLGDQRDVARLHPVAEQRCLKAADDPALADPPGTLWLQKLGERLGTEILDLEQRADLSPGGVGNDGSKIRFEVCCCFLGRPSILRRG